MMTTATIKITATRDGGFRVADLTEKEFAELVCDYASTISGGQTRVKRSDRRTEQFVVWHPSVGGAPFTESYFIRYNNSFTRVKALHVQVSRRSLVMNDRNAKRIGQSIGRFLRYGIDAERNRIDAERVESIDKAGVDRCGDCGSPLGYTSDDPCAKCTTCDGR